MTEASSRPAPGRLVFFEGPDGVGKTTLHRLALKAISDLGRVRGFAFPGNQEGTLGELVYRVHHERGGLPFGDIDPLALQILHVAAHVDAIRRRIRPALDAGETVILDRFWWSTWVYGVVNGVATKLMDELVELEMSVWGNAVPAVGILVKRAIPFRQESSPKRFAALCEGYEEIASRVNHPVIKIINNDPLPVVAERMLTGIHSHMGRV